MKKIQRIAQAWTRQPSNMKKQKAKLKLLKHNRISKIQNKRRENMLCAFIFE